MEDEERILKNRMNRRKISRSMSQSAVYKIRIREKLKR